MTFNEGTWDRVIRMMVGFGFGYAAWVTWPMTALLQTQTAITSLAYLLVGFEVFFTGALGWSPLYALFDWSTTAKAGA